MEDDSERICTEYVIEISALLKACKDAALLDLIFKLLLKSCV